MAAIAAAALVSAAVTLPGNQRATAQTPNASNAAARTPRAPGVVAVRDAETGQLRDATPAELLELQGQSTQEASVPEPIVSATGLSGLTLGADQMTFTVATRNADGTVGVQHAAGKRDAERLVQAGAQVSVAGKEQLHEK